jgi:organic hydroperoxide reductase OsmC/OhrA
VIQSKVQLRNVPGTEAALGWAGSHTVMIDRPEGKAGGMGLGFNGGQMLALALGGCYCNDLRYAAEKLGVKLADIEVAVTLDLAGEPLVAARARLEVHCTTADGADPAPVIARAAAECTVKNSLERGLPVSVQPRARSN